jgi:S-adenosylmethionine:tRNA ribosyltransferase-isomerase
MSTVAFALPPDSEATAPPEWRGLARDEVRLLAVDPVGVRHRRFFDLPALLRAGDLLVVNTSATLPGRIDVRRADGVLVPLHVSTQLDDGDWVVELRRPDNTGPDLRVEPGTAVDLPGGGRLVLLEGHPDPGRPGRLWRARPARPTSIATYLPAHGRPIGYGYLAGDFPLAARQNVYADEPGSAEMASAGRPFSAEVLVRLVVRGVVLAPLTLHTGVSSPELHEPPYPERYAVPATTARLVNETRAAGGRVVAVGTTVTRALETVADRSGTVHAGTGWTDLVLGPDRPARVVTGLVTGLHAPEASHLDLLEAVAGPSLVARGYEAAVTEHYLWHEFGDSMLFLP